METFEPLARFFNSGGIFMYPIAITLALALAVAVERFIFLMRWRRDNRRLWSEVSPLLAQGDLAGAELLTASSDTAVAKILANGLAQTRIDSRRSELEIATEEGLMEVLPAIERRTHYLATFSNVATLLGLLGTVLGLIGAFAALGAADASQKADLLSAGISEAMNCTAFGLMVAIPSLLLHSWLQSRTGELVDSLESVCSRFVSSICNPARAAR
ncbi:MotA/TolQ/ExbB proton channel family protein [Solimonas sp. SE-A11]|uniref:MotA/TolQ/ExbB proton channel family protein n=1 Tax=Solimonas sp. SE-A11 TaxID=3054954 RepID=UPI00259CA3B8|nr:MotA/TolQ/ExbB proton channel family protein [Solimonas sp. SE-A11]MDM4768735.1 MotA/TolQ/ExbB proton channel family protein [Solimonas sp. SE-A11]